MKHGYEVGSNIPFKNRESVTMMNNKVAFYKTNIRSFFNAYIVSV